MSWRHGESEDHFHPRGRGSVPPWRQRGRDSGNRSHSQDHSSIETDSFSRRGRGNWRKGGSKGERDQNKRGAKSQENLCEDFLPERKRKGPRERQYPIGRKQLEQLLDQQPDLVVLELLREQSGYQLYLQQDEVRSESLILLIRVLARACSAKSNKENLFDLFSITCEQKFLDRLCAFSMTIKRQYPNEASNFFLNLHIFLETYANAMTTNAIDKITDLIDACISALGILQDQGFVAAEVKEKYEELQKMLTEAREKWIREKSQTWKGQRGRYAMDEMEPPDDFRDLPVHPVPYDLSKQQRPFLRRNIVEGKYKDSKHYLDVQFRLLREDFVRPLRNGINDFIYNMKNIREVRIYRNVSIVGSDIRRRCIIHYIQLNLPKHFQFVNSKRLLYGNFLCFSKDNFRSMILASVAERDVDMGKEGIIGVKFESDIQDLDLSGNFTMVESRAYFMAYKHVLKTLQNMSDTRVPMEQYIIHVNQDVKTPTYLDKEDNSYDLRVITDTNMMKKSEIHNKLKCLQFQFRKHLDIEQESDTEEASDNRFEELRSVPMCHGIEVWPSHLQMGLDTSQHRALHGALTRQFAIIQGPPGTGKTFIGLKITQTLLHNSQFWKDEDNPTPILVVCYTNHALDQFLEGIMTYTRSIVRVGSRSKNEAISKFQINNLAVSLRQYRGIPRAIHDRSSELFDNVIDLEYKVKNLRAIANTCVDPEGIFKLKSLLQEDVIPKHLQDQIMQGTNQMTKWLLLNMQSDDLRNASSKETLRPDVGNTAEVDGSQPGLQEHDNGLKDNDNYDDYLQDAEELMQLEEKDRRLDDLDDIPMRDQNIKVFYEITYKMLDESMKELVNCENDPEEFFRYAIYKSQKECLQIGLNLPESHAEMAKLETQDINMWKLDFPTRWRLYKFWLYKLYLKVVKKLTILEATFQRKAKALQEIKDQEFLHIMRHHSIVGMTTTGAAQYSAVMQDLSPAIVIIEEAAEILESHVITALTSKCQHLILIGDHQQLRPSATVYELATKYGLETSLFERMIKNGLAYESLQYQHRMRPSISKLLVPSIYPELKDHTSVTTYPHIKGVKKDLFFISHEIHERKESDDNNSHENLHEAELMIGLCRHLMLQGYDPADVTILTPYSGQFFLLRKLQREHPVCSGVRICVVDNFQGEENKIILLSLVRSNEEGKVGFLSTDNRVCVALSRAKHGLYITGNINLLCESSTLWQKIHNDLLSGENIDNALPLKCENHPDEEQKVSSGPEFFTKSPEGGCMRPCNRPLSCGHNCPKLCHLQDIDHENYNCRVPCPKLLCELEHPCPKKCFEKCGPCKVMVPKTLPCTHSHTIQCHIAPENYDCPTPVERIIPACQHKVTMPCSAKPADFICPEDCDIRVDCGHMCRQKCHVKRDPEHKKYNCFQKCTRLNAGCTENHPCVRQCYEECGACVTEITKVLPCGHTAKNVPCHIPAEEYQCQQKCKRTLSCGHACKKMCNKPCGNCQVKVKKTVPECGHTITIECGEDATTEKCDGPCTKTLQCGHPCLERCNETCTQMCMEQTVSSSKCPKNHDIRIPCCQNDKISGEDTWIYCDKLCGQTLECEHTCEGKCGQCFQGRVHMSCRKKCKKSLVCGHICKHPCSAKCPPCLEQCEWRCSHSKCKKKCGLPCETCKESCQWKCKHLECNKHCGSKCSRKPCYQPCKKMLKCGHQCIGFCGDPCPPLCRDCNHDELTDFVLLGYEDDDDARFVMLEDCGHCIEVQGLEGWLQQESAEIGMKRCPKCSKPIYNNRRYQDIILETYKMVKNVKNKYFTMNPRVRRKDIEMLLSAPEICHFFVLQATQLQKQLGMGSSTKGKRPFFNEAELRLFEFQAQVLKKASKLLYEEEKENQGSIPYIRTASKASPHLKKLKDRVTALVNRVMQEKQIVAPQTVDEVSCELQRLMILPPYWKLLERSKSSCNSSLTNIVAKLERIMCPTIKFDSLTENKVKELLKEGETYVGGLRISDSERLMILKAMGLKQGHWYKCPNGHVYCITECGGAQQSSKCPDCGAAIGGVSYRLNTGNAVATEMDGSTHAAWSDQHNLANYGNI